MFDTKTTQIIQQAMPLEGLDLEKLPQFLTKAYAKVVAARLGAVALGKGEKDEKWSEILVELSRLADTYEGLSIFLPDENPHRASCAFVSGSAHHTLSQARKIEAAVNKVDTSNTFLSPHGINPEVSACLLFLMAGQQADAAETAKLFNTAEDAPHEKQLLHGIAALASGDGDLLCKFAGEKLVPLDEKAKGDYFTKAAVRLWSSLGHAVQLIALKALGEDDNQEPHSEIESVLNQIKRARGSIRTGDLEVTIRLGLEGPYHLARLLQRVSDVLLDTAVSRRPPPSGVDKERWANFTRSFAKRRPFLWQNHVTAFKRKFLNSGRSSVLTFPTGAGKTTITELRIAAELLRDRKVVYLAPTKALVDQVSRDLSETLAPIPGTRVRSRFFEEFGARATDRVLVHTPERCLAYLSFDPDAHKELGLIVVDECHQLSGELPDPNGEQPLPGRRSVDAMWTLLLLLNRSPGADVVLISAMVRNASQLERWLKKATKRKATALDLPWKPTRQVRGVVVYEEKEIEQLKKTLHIRQQAAPFRKKPGKKEREVCAAQPIGLFCHTQVWAKNSAFAKFPILPNVVPLGVNEHWVPTANRNMVGAMLLGAMVRAKMRPIVFCQQIDWATKIAKVGAAAVKSTGLSEVKLTPDEDDLFNAAATELGTQQHVERPRGNRVGVHHGLLIWPERMATESAFRRSDGLLALVATPTVAQGINMPAEAVIIAGDDRWDEKLGKGRMKPLAVHELLNAAGRAGRAGHYAHGIVIDLPGGVLTVSQKENIYSVYGLEHIMSLLGQPDQCLDVVDPLTQVLDRVQSAGVDADVSEYLVRRAAGLPNDMLVAILGASLGNSLHKHPQENASSQAKFLKAAGLQLDRGDEYTDDIDLDKWRKLASRAGVSNVAIATIASRIPASEVVATWAFEDLRKFATHEVIKQLFALVDPDSSALSRIILRKRTRKQDGTYEYTETVPEWQSRWQLVIREVLPLWLAGKPISDIDDALHRHRDAKRRVSAIRLGRRFSLQLAPSLAYGLFVVTRVVIEVTKGKHVPQVLMSQLPLLSGCIREGFNEPDMLLLFWHLHRIKPGLFPRVVVHQEFEKIRGRLPSWSAETSVDERRALLKAACQEVGLP